MPGPRGWDSMRRSEGPVCPVVPRPVGPPTKLSRSSPAESLAVSDRKAAFAEKKDMWGEAT